MKRSPMKRSLPPPRKPAKVIEYQPRPRTPAKPVLVADGKARMVVPVPKAQPLRDEGYRRLVATLPCCWCAVIGHSQAAHANFGKGMGIKASDAETFPLCGPSGNNCHQHLDQGGQLIKAQRREYEELWACHTRMRLRQMAAGDADVRKIVSRSIGL